MSRANVNPTNPSSSHHLHFSWQKLRVTVCRRIHSTRRRYYRSLSPVSELPGAFDFFPRPFKTAVRRVDGDEPRRGDSLQRIFHGVALSRALTWGPPVLLGMYLWTDPSYTLNALRDVCTRGIHCGPLRWFSVYANTSAWKTLEGKYSTWYYTVL